MASFSGRTETLLRAGAKKAHANQGAFPDGEDGAPCVLNTVSVITRAALDTPLVVTGMILAAAPLLDPLPTNFAALKDPATALEAARVHQAAVRADMVQREASREALRRLLIARETVEWRREQMEATFSAERLAANEVLRQTAATHADVLTRQRRAFEKASALASSQRAIHARRDESAASARSTADAAHAALYED